MLNRLFLAAALMLSVTSAVGASFDWLVSSPESQGIASAQLEVIRARMAAKKSRAFLVIRNDHVVCEWYAPGVDASMRQGTASLAKALVGGMSLAVALEDGRLALDDPAARFIPQWKSDPRKSKITIRQLGSHTSGLADSTTENLPHEEQPGWMGDFWKRLDPPRDPFTIARDETPLIFEPGTRLQYSNPGIGLMTYCVTAAIRTNAQRDVRTLLRDRILRPIGVADKDWSAGYGKTFEVDGLPLVASWGGGAFTPRATARIGRLVLRGGDWDGQRLLGTNVVRQVTTDAGLVGNCGMGWWSNGGGRYPNLPKDAVWGAGAGDQLLLVIPSLNLIMVRNGEMLMPGPDEPALRQEDVFTKYHDYRAHILFEPLAAAVTNRVASVDVGSPGSAGSSSIPASPVIRDVIWAPSSTIVRLAPGSDNWPITWADDDALYTAYGDGLGFAPFEKEKLSLGFARVIGSAQQPRGENIHALSLRSTGNGEKGRKASGLLCVDGVFYLWMRNVGNSQLAWSRDHGESWSFAAWRFTNGFGCPTFLEFGRNYAGARDRFVYVYSPDADSAYQPAERIVLARVPSARILEQGAYEFFAGLDAGGIPRWSSAARESQAVIRRAGLCYRPRVSYDAGLRRYLLVQALPGLHSHDAVGQWDTRRRGGLAIYDAPEPWGPWTVAWQADDWDVGPGDSASFPPKWMSPDGTELNLVFSGDDSFAVRRARFILRHESGRSPH